MRQRRLIFSLGLVALLVLLAACNAAQPAPVPTAVPTLAPTATTAPSPTPQPAPTTAPESTQASSTDQTAATILQQSSDAMKQVESMQFTYNTTVNMAGQSITTGGQGMYQKPGQMYMKLEAMGQSIEMLVMEDGKVYVKMPGSDKFTLSTPPTNDNSNGNSNDNTNDSSGSAPNDNSVNAPNIMAQAMVGEFANQTTLEGEETVNGAPAYVISYKMDISKYFHVDPSNAPILDPAQATGEGKIWIDKDNYRVLKSTYTIGGDASGNNLSIVTEMVFSNYNEPVQIPTP